jgi:hypothetical protein
VLPSASALQPSAMPAAPSQQARSREILSSTRRPQIPIAINPRANALECRLVVT